MGLGPTFRQPKISVPLILPADLLERINRSAMQHGINRSAFIREVIERALVTGSEHVRDGEPAETGAR